MPGYMDVPAAIEVAKKHLADKRRVLKLIDTVRSDLRNAVDRKETNKEQTDWIEGTFPIRERKRKPKNGAAPVTPSTTTPAAP